MNIFLIGPTAVGKTELSLLLAERLGCPIVSADSRQCYRGMDVGTGKATEAELSRVPHYNVSIFTPDVPDDAAAFVRRVDAWQHENNTSRWLFVGGSTLYVQSLLFPLDEVPRSKPEVVAGLEEEIGRHGLPAMFDRLRNVDPAYALKMDGLNRQRIVRAMAVWMQTGRPFSDFHSREGFQSPLNAVVFGLDRHRESLVRRISERVDAMFRGGLVDEVRALLAQGYVPDMNALRTVGYQEVIEWLQGRGTEQETVDAVKAHTRQYARRQMTWFRRWPFVEWFNLDDIPLEQAVQAMYSRVLEVERQSNKP